MSQTTAQNPLIEPRAEGGEPNLVVAYILWLLLGLVSGHRFYLGKPLSALLQFVSYAFLVGFLWWAADAFLLPGLVAERRRVLHDQASPGLTMAPPPPSTTALTAALAPPPAPQPQPSRAAPATSGNLEELEKLWALKQSGALSDSEYNDQKARLLGNA